MFQKGHKKHGGRKKGIQNVRTGVVEVIAAKMMLDPFQILCCIASNDYEALGYVNGQITVGERLHAASIACRYLYSQKAAIEISGTTKIEVEVREYRPDK